MHYLIVHCAIGWWWCDTMKICYEILFHLNEILFHLNEIDDMKFIILPLIGRKTFCVSLHIYLFVGFFYFCFWFFNPILHFKLILLPLVIHIHCSCNLDPFFYLTLNNFFFEFYLLRRRLKVIRFLFFSNKISGFFFGIRIRNDNKIWFNFLFTLYLHKSYLISTVIFYFSVTELVWFVQWKFDFQVCVLFRFIYIWYATWVCQGIELSLMMMKNWV